MATLISKATGNFTDSGTWAPIDSASELDSEAASSNPSTGGTSSSAFTPAANEIDGVAIKVRQLGTGGGTVTVKLANQTSPGSREGTVTVNANDLLTNIQSTAMAPGCWCFFKFTNVTPNGTDSYKVTVTVSVANNLVVWSDITAGNWARMLRRTSAASAPAAGDKLVMIGEFTGAGTSNSFTITMNETATTSYGPTVSGGPPQGMIVGDKATLSYGVAASTNYYLKVKGILAVTAGGTFSIGTSGSQMPSTSTAVLEFDSVANVDTGLDIGNGATCNMWGATQTNVFQYLTADKAAAATTLSVADTTGWAANDELVIASTTRTFSDTEKRVIQSVDSSTQVTLTAGLTNAHSGTSPTAAEVINITRNVKVRGISTSLQGYIYANLAATVVFRYAEFLQLGSNTLNKRGITVQTTTGSFDMQYCAPHDFVVGFSIGVFVSQAAANHITYSYNVSYNMQACHFQISLATSGTWTAQHNVGILTIGTGTIGVFSIADVGGVFTDNIAVSASSSTPGIVINENADIGTIANLTAHSCGTNGIQYTGGNNGTVTNLTAWRCNSGSTAGGSVSIGTPNANMPGIVNTVFDGITVFGSATNLAIFATLIGVTINNLNAAGDTTFSSRAGVGVLNGAQGIHEVLFTNCDLGTATGIKVAHTTADIEIGFTGTRVRFVLHNCKLATSTEVSAGAGTLSSKSYVRSQRHDQTVGLHKAWYAAGQSMIDTSTYRTASPSELLTPSSASAKLESGLKRIGVSNGVPVTITAHVKKSGAYNGNAPRLRERKNVAAGIAADSTIATLSGGAEGDGWWTLSGTTSTPTDDAMLEYYVDCDGTAGTLSVDDWAVA